MSKSSIKVGDNSVLLTADNEPIIINGQAVQCGSVWILNNGKRVIPMFVNEYNEIRCLFFIDPVSPGFLHFQLNGVSLSDLGDGEYNMSRKADYAYISIANLDLPQPATAEDE